MSGRQIGQTYQSDRMTPSCGTAAFGDQAVGLWAKELISNPLPAVTSRILRTNDTRSEVEVVTNNIDEVLVGLLARTVRVDVDGQRLSNTNGIGELDKSAASKATRDQGLSCKGYQSYIAAGVKQVVRTNPTSGVRSGPVNLGPVLAREGTSSMSTPTTVGVDNNLTASETGITLGTADDETPRRLNLIAKM